MSTDNKALCELCGEPMPKGEEMFKYHGYSGGCPKPPMKSEPTTTESTDRELKAFADSLAEKIYGEPRLDQTDCAKLIYEALVTRPEGGGMLRETIRRLADKTHNDVMEHREEILRAFVAKYVYQPDEIEQVEKRGEDGETIFYVRRRPEGGVREEVYRGMDSLIEWCERRTATGAGYKDLLNIKTELVIMRSLLPPQEEDIRIGDRISIGDYETVCEGFTTVAGQKMVKTPTGDFGAHIVKKILDNRKDSDHA